MSLVEVVLFTTLVDSFGETFLETNILRLRRRRLGEFEVRLRELKKRFGGINTEL